MLSNNWKKYIRENRCEQIIQDDYSITKGIVVEFGCRRFDGITLRRVWKYLSKKNIFFYTVDEKTTIISYKGEIAIDNRIKFRNIGLKYNIYKLKIELSTYSKTIENIKKLISNDLWYQRIHSVDICSIQDDKLIELLNLIKYKKIRVFSYTTSYKPKIEVKSLKFNTVVFIKKNLQKEFARYYKKAPLLFR